MHRRISKHGRSLSMPCLALLTVLVCTLSAIPARADPDAAKGLTTEQQAAKLLEATTKRRANLTLSIACVEILDRQWTDWFGDHDDSGKSTQDAVARLRQAARTKLDACRDAPAERGVLTLVGAGDVVVYVPFTEFTQAQNAASTDASVLRLYLNGVDQGSDGQVVSVEHLKSKDMAAVRFHIKRGTDNRPLWTALYKAADITAATPLRVALGWSTVGAVTPSQGFSPEYNIRISDGFALAMAAALIAGLLAGAAWVLFRTDTFRDAPTDRLWAIAQGLRRRLHAAQQLNARLNPGDQQRQRAVRMQLLDGFQPGAVFDESRTQVYLQAAALALHGGKTDDAAFVDTVYGLCIRDARWTPIRATFSLGRVQAGMWFVFVVVTGVFLWAVFGSLPDLPSSMLALLTVSGVTAGASAMTDSYAGGRPFEASRGFWHDLTTGFDNKQQLHRFQAVVVNILLLCVALSEVFGELVYPSFEPAWLGFLGLSGAALAVGKQVAEAPSPNAGTTADPAPNAEAVAAAVTVAQATPKTDMPSGPTL